MNRSIGGVKVKVITSVTLLITVIVMVAIITVAINNGNVPSTGSTVATTTKSSDKTEFTKDNTNEELSADDSYQNPKGVTESTESSSEKSSPNINRHPNDNRSSNQKKTSTNDTSSNNNSGTELISQSSPTSATDSANKEAVSDDDAEARAREEALRQQYENPTIWQASNTYDQRENCPSHHGTYSTIGGYPVCECTSYVAWKAYEEHNGLILSNWGNANNWVISASRNGYRVDNTPAVNSIGVIETGAYGHLIWVEQVNPDGSIVTSEYNNNLATYRYSGEYRFYDYGTLTYSSSVASQFKFIHLDQYNY